MKKEKTADEMFEELGYKKVHKDIGIVEYINEPKNIEISFLQDFKTNNIKAVVLDQDEQYVIFEDCEAIKIIAKYIEEQE